MLMNCCEITQGSGVVTDGQGEKLSFPINFGLSENCWKIYFLSLNRLIGCNITS